MFITPKPTSLPWGSGILNREIQLEMLSGSSNELYSVLQIPVLLDDTTTLTPSVSSTTGVVPGLLPLQTEWDTALPSCCGCNGSPMAWRGSRPWRSKTPQEGSQRCPSPNIFQLWVCVRCVSALRNKSSSSKSSKIIEIQTEKQMCCRSGWPVLAG